MIGVDPAAIAERGNVSRLVDFLVELPAHHTPALLNPFNVVCMNQTQVCTSCIFYEGRMAKYCPPSEREAKAAYDLQEIAA